MTTLKRKILTDVRNERIENGVKKILIVKSSELNVSSICCDLDRSIDQYVCVSGATEFPVGAGESGAQWW